MATKNTKILGLAVGESGLLLAEIAGGERPFVTKLGEIPYVAGATLAEPAGLGKALAHYLKEHGILARDAVAGIPAKWLLVKPKEVPDAHDDVVADMLRLEAESEFSSELKDLIFDYVGKGERGGQGVKGSRGQGAQEGQPAAGGATKSVLLVATQRKQVANIEAVCEGARVNLVAVTATALVLGKATSAAERKNLLVLTLGAAGSELTAYQAEDAKQIGGRPRAIRHLRGATPQPPFLSELRRAVSTIGGGAGREMVLWGEPAIDAAALKEQLGLAVRHGELSALGIDTSLTGSNGDGARFGAPVALAMVGLDEKTVPVDFLHSRLAPPAKRRIPLWAWAAGAVVGMLIVGFTLTTISLSGQQARLAGVPKVDPKQLSDARDFAAKVTLSSAWFNNDPRYLACVRALLMAVPNPQDGDTYATSLDLREVSRMTANAPDNRAISGVLVGKTSDKQHALDFLTNISHEAGFSDVTPGGIDNNNRGGEVNFTITFTYQAPASSAAKGN